MHFTTRSFSTAFVILSSLLLFSPHAAMAADNMWDGVFAYQKKMADYGNAEAQTKLGEMYEEGHGTAQDFAVAREWYEKAAAQGYAPASEKIKKLEAREQRAVAAAKAEEARLAREKAERLKAEQERVAREQAAREAAEKAAREKADQERLARERAEEQKRLAEEKKHKAEEERLARERAEKAIKAMLAAPSGYSED